ncbi:response regulator transcription factor [Amnibacterium kyonggiense]
MKVLLLEDDPALGQELALRMKRADLVVDLVDDIEDADLQRSITRYDCLVLDRRVHGGDALELVDRIRRDGDTVPILVASALGDLGDRVAGLEGGADDYLAKPFDPVELVARVRALARRGPLARRTVLAAGDIRMDVPRHRVTRDGVLLILSAKEFAVLEVLLEDPGVVVSRAELLDRCWDEAADPSSNVVDVLIGQLRRRLGAPDLIEAVRGVGYRITDGS